MCDICAGTGIFDPGRHPGGGTFATIFEGVDAPGDDSTPYSISVGDVFSGELGIAGDQDWVAVRLEAGQTYTISVSGSASGAGTLSDPYMRVYDADGNLVGSDDDGGNGFDSETSFTASTTGTYYISTGGYSDSIAGTYEVSVEAETPPEPASLNELADYLVNGYWEDTGRSARSFDTSGSNQITYDISGLTAEGQQLALWAMEAWELMADIEFVEADSDADITFDDEDSGAYAQTFTSGGDIISVNVNVSTNWLATYGTTIDSYSFQTYVHEIGHALGLGHQGAYNGSARYGTDATFSNDSWQISIMSYFSQSENTTTDASYALLLTPMMADIVAIQSIYGDSDVTRGRTVWGENSNLGGYIGEVFAEMAGESDSADYDGDDMAFTIFDAGGRDLIDLSYATEGMRVDLRPGSFSDVGGLTGNMAIARGTIIEELFTGSGADDVTGNRAGNLIRTFGGDDTISAGGGRDRVFGGAGDDIIRGGGGRDKLFGGGGADELNGGNGRDVMRGGGGRDALDGGNHNDRLFGGRGRDTLRGEAGSDSLDGKKHNDRLFGGGGDDDLSGGRGRDKLFGGGGADELNGGTGRDVLRGGGGRDTVEGGNHNDRLFGGRGRDTLRGEAGSDSLNGKKHNDRLFGGGGADELDGGNGRDVLRGGGGRDTVEGGNHNDRLFGGRGRDTLRGEAGSDSLDGKKHNDRLFGGGGADELDGGNGRDVLRGGGGRDTVEGGNHNDRLFGGGGRDTLRGEAGDDALNGGKHKDRLIGGGGEDDLSGGRGRDKLFGGGGADELNGGNGRDVLRGGGGRDTVDGGNHNDRLFGGRGRDEITGGQGNDIARGGNGADTFVFSDGHDRFTIRDFSFSDNDRLELDDDLWNGSMNARQVVNTYGDVVDGDMVLDFGDGDIIVLEGVTSARQLANYIDIV